MFSDAYLKDKIKRKDAEIASLKQKVKEQNEAIKELLSRNLRLEEQINSMNEIFGNNSKDLQESIEELDELKNTYREKVKEIALLKKQYTKDMEAYLKKLK